ncbi:MAG: Xaa-Pro peptidase family protein [Eubacteriales bacterium]|nr:Xaa-Pro peptidase family protein [Eubacteriales bacterium]
MNHFIQIKKKIAKAGLDGILLNSEANRFYASDFPTMAEDDGRVLVTKEDCYFITDSRYTEAAQNRIKDAIIVIRENAASYIDILKELTEKHEIKKLGFEERALTVKQYNDYSSSLDCEFIPASDLLEDLRQSKDDDEIRSMIAAQRIAEKSLEQLLTEIKEGQTEKEISARLQYLMYLNGAERMSFDPIVASGPNSSMPHAVPTDRKIQAGDFLTLDFGCIYNGYCSDMTRTVAIGYATDEMKKVYETVLLAQLKGISLARTGVIGKEVHNAASEVIAAAGYGGYFGHGFGHSLGIEIHESPNFNSRNDKPMPDRAAVSAEPGIYLPGKFGVRIEDVVVLKEEGCEDITLAPKELMILPV